MRFLLIKVPKGNEYLIEQTYTLLSNLVEKKAGGFLGFGKKSSTYSLEVVCFSQKIHFIVGVPDDRLDFFSAQLLAQYKEAMVEPFSFSEIKLKTNDKWFFNQMILSKPEYLPLKTSEEFRETDPLASVLATMAKAAKPDYFFLFQILLTPASSGWQDSFFHTAQTGGGKNEHGDYQYHPQKQQIEDKAKHPGFRVYIRLLTNKKETLEALSGSFGVFTNPGGNGLNANKPFFGKKKLLSSIWQRRPCKIGQILNLAEIASMWHLPSIKVDLPNISWGRQTRADPPENLPVATDLSDAEKKQITFIGKTEFKNEETTFGIKRKDRQRHVYIIGKTGTGKSWLLANMIIEDIRKGEGVAIVDPHGDLVEIILRYIPKNRINDVCFFNPADPKYGYPLNPLEVTNESQKELVASGIVSIFHKLYANSWGPRLEHILRNTLLTLTSVPGHTLVDVIAILTDKRFRVEVIGKLKDRTLIRFWEQEFDSMSEKFRQEAISPILNKVGQYVSSPLIRKNIAYPVSKVKI